VGSNPTLSAILLTASALRIFNPPCFSFVYKNQISPTLSSAPPLHALKHGCWELDHPNSVSLFGSHANRNAARIGKRIGNHFKFLSVQANALADAVSETLHAGTNFRKRGRYIRLAGRNDLNSTFLENY
jgi:hypothetical protein